MGFGSCAGVVSSSSSFFTVFALLLLVGVMAAAAAGGRRMSQTTTTNMAALLAFKSAVLPQGNPDDPLPNWVGTDSSPCSWTGVTCNSDNEELVLGSNSFSGVIPPEIGTLSMLQYLDLSSNTFSGTLPVHLGNLVNLQHLDLSSNALSGPIPSQIWGMTSLQELDLGANALTGSLPRELGNLINLQNLALDNNQLTGSIPPELCNAAMLSQVTLNVNNLTGDIIHTFQRCMSLTEIDLTSNHVSGPIPSYLANLPNLVILSLGSNNFSGDVPDALWTSQSLLEILLDSNKLTGSLSPLIGNVTTLEYLVLANNNLEGPIPPEIGKLSNLNVFSVASNNLNGQIPVELCSCIRLTSLNLGNNLLMGPIPQQIGQLINLDYLVLSHNSLTGNIPNTICSIPPELARLTKLTTLDLSCNLLNGSIPAELGEVHKLQALNLAYNRLTGQIPPQLGDITSLTKLNLNGNMLSGSIPITLGNLMGLSHLDLSNNQLSGDLPSSLANLNSILIYLDLSNNHLSGMFPPELCDLRYLTFLNVSNNELEGQIPSTGMCAKLGTSSFIADPGLCGDELRIECTRKTGPTSLVSTGAISGIAIGCTIVFLSMLFVVLSTCLTIGKSKEPLSINVAMFEQPLLRLTLADILLATNNFCKANIIGDGGFGTVYKAILPDGKTVAIKKLGAARTQGNREFLAEMETLGKVKHQNLVPLLGYCSFGEEKLLVYEYMVNGSLDLWLRNRADAVEVLDWSKRFKIAMGSARGLNFLHHGFIPHIIHRDVKTSNILLDADFEPRVADFGLARLISAYETHVSTDIAGTFGYIPPEYGQSWRSTTRGDVYSYGVILLELLTGKEPTGVDFKDIEGGNLVGWVRQMIKQGAAQETLDATVSNGPWKMSMLKVLHIANLCTAEDPLMRPTMLQVVKYLKDVE
ncbi:unnamed protein product, partial [Sphagnum tenellum]